MLLVFGSVALNQVHRCSLAPRRGESVRSNVRAEAGGHAVIAAMAAGRMGMDVHVVGCIGTDDAGAQLRRSLEGHHLKHHLQLSEDAPTALQATVLDDAGEFLRSESQGANALLAFDGAVSETLRDATGVLVDMGANSQAVIKLLQAASDAGKLRIVHAMPPSASHLQLAAPFADLLLMAGDSFSALVRQKHPGGYGDFTGEQIHALPDARLHELCRVTADADLVLMLGRRGVFLSTKSAYRLVPPDSRGAPEDAPDGSSVLAGLIAAFLQNGGGLREAAELALKGVGYFCNNGKLPEALPKRSDLV